MLKNYWVSGKQCTDEMLHNVASHLGLHCLLRPVCSNTYGIYSTLQPLYNTVRYNTVLGITRFKDGSQKCIDYIEK